MAKKTVKRFGRTVSGPTFKEWGKSKVVKGEGVDLQKIVTGYSAGYQPMAHQEVDFQTIDLQDITEDQFDLPDIEQFQRLDVVEQVQVRSNLQIMQNALNGKMDTLKQQYAQKAKPVADPIPEPPKKEEPPKE